MLDESPDIRSDGHRQPVAGCATGPAHGFPIDRDSALRHPGQCRDPGDETALEWRRVEGGEDVAGVTVRPCDGAPSRNGRNRRRRSRFLSPKRAISTKASAPASRASSASKSTSSSGYVISPALGWIGQVTETIEKNNRLEKHLMVRRRVVHGHSPPSASSGPSWIQRFTGLCI